MQTALQLVMKFHPEVTTVRDATHNTRIEVTAKDINTMARKKHTECALAIACKRTKDIDGVIIGVSSAYLIKGKTATRYSLPQSARREIVSFDRTGDFAPGSYHLASVPETMRLNSKRGNTSGRTAKVKREYRHVTEGIRHYE